MKLPTLTLAALLCGAPAWADDTTGTTNEYTPVECPGMNCVIIKSTGAPIALQAGGAPITVRAGSNTTPAPECVPGCVYDPSATSNPIAPPPDRSWHLLTVSEGGTVSLIRDLTAAECAALQMKMLPHRTEGQWFTPMPGDLVRAECFQ